MDYAELIKIDKYALDNELLEQSSIYMEICDMAAEAASIRDKLKTDLDEMASRISLGVRQSPPIQIKITEDTVAAMVATNPELISAQADYLEAKAETDRLMNTKAAFEMRAKMLHDLVALHISSYYSASAEGHGPRHEAAEYDGLRDRIAAQRRNKTGE